MMPERSTSTPRSRAGLREILFAVRGSIIRLIAWKVAMLTTLACGVVYWTKLHGDPLSAFGIAPFSFIGISISVFLSFRNNACYDRWWEARKQWGRLIVAARSFARETMALPVDRRRLLRAVCAYAHALRARLDGTSEADACRTWGTLGPVRPGSANATNRLLDQIGQECSRLADEGRISEWRYMLLESRLVEMSEVQAACERIKNTPLPFAYTLLIHRTTYLFCCLLPFGVAPQLGWSTPILVAVVSYTFFGLDAIGDELEDPFGRNENDLPLDDLVRTIETDIGESLEAG
ncbi:membrane protein [Aliidongia dinghuensis]|uniref:Membrane protein n=1 Tax=Aliidongia dinghuensis TaxID=1867774 RepID=A0A8J3E1W8_9PROT|nr:bestrophin family protein [Aliidongia dinghuensis]GGF04904.1 membrane protein [Aliidongia dinghuensis]